jgi:hypothetical protein
MPLLPGTLAPMFVTAGLENPAYAFNSVAGRPVVLAFLGPDAEAARPLAQAIAARAGAFDDRAASLFILFRRPEHLAALRLGDRVPGIRCLLDAAGRIATAYGLGPAGAADLPALVVLDRHLRVLAARLAADASGLAEALARIDAHARWRARQDALGRAPVLVVDGIFDAGLCERLIAHYERSGGAVSGFMRDVGGMTRGLYDDGFKKRRDCQIEDVALRDEARSMVGLRLRPLIRQAFQFDASRIERDIVACYTAEEGGFFRPHRDNSTAATRHRRFAVTLNLNAEDYEGGDLAFPEFGDALYRAPTGGAVVFSTALLHEARSVTRGCRYAYLPFLYGEADAETRQRGQAFLAGAEAPAAPPAPAGPASDEG